MNINLGSFFVDGLSLDEIVYDSDIIKLVLSSSQEFSACPTCKKLSSKNHSTYDRTLMDLPILGCTVYLNLTVRKFFCNNYDCEQKIFTERFKELIEPYARRTNRLEDVIIAVAFSSDSKTSSKVAKKLSFAASPNTFLRTIRKMPINVNEDVKIIAVDDWAYRKGHNYGTIICDHESRKPIELFLGRTAIDLEKWLLKHPQITLATRDRSDSYAAALNNICPMAIQVADRFHLVKNLLDAVKKFATRIFPRAFRLTEPPVNSEEKIEKDSVDLSKTQDEIEQRREEKKKTIRKVKELRSSGMILQDIANIMKLSKNTVNRYIYLDEERASRRRSTRWHGYDKYEPLIVELIRQGKKNVEIRENLRDKGATAGKSTVNSWVAKLKVQDGHPIKPQKRRVKEKWLKRYDMTSILWFLKEKLKKEEKESLEKIFEKFPIAYKAYCIIQKFRQMVKSRDGKSLANWIEEAIESNIIEITKFAKGLQENFEEVYNAFLYSYSNGLAEGHINRLKMLKRMMFGRAKLDLLRQRVLFKW